MGKCLPLLLLLLLGQAHRTFDKKLKEFLETIGHFTIQNLLGKLTKQPACLRRSPATWIEQNLPAPLLLREMTETIIQE